MTEPLSDESVRACREVVRGELVADGLSAEGAEAWCDAWEAEADRLGIDGHTQDCWTIGSVWIKEQRRSTAA